MKKSYEFNPDRIPVRKPIIDFKKDIPLHWLSGNLFKTHFANTLSVLFPDAESYFIRTVKKFLPQLELVRLKKDVLSFIGQETQHKKVHEKTWKVLEKHGFVFKKFLNFYNHLSFNIIESKLTDKQNLAVVAGLEHFTAIISEFALENDLLKDSEPMLQSIFEWHAAEELEHKHVAFDLLHSVDPEYESRIIGYIIASMLFSFYSSVNLFSFFLQDDPAQWQRALRELEDFFWKKDKALPKIFIRYIEYFHPEFHPHRRNTTELSKAILKNMDFEPILNTDSANLEDKSAEFNRMDKISDKK